MGSRRVQVARGHVPFEFSRFWAFRPLLQYAAIATDDASRRTDPMPTAADPASDTEPNNAPTRPIVVADHYEIDLEHPLGTGGMSVVYEGRDLKNRRTVAMRTLRPEQSRNPETRAR